MLLSTFMSAAPQLTAAYSVSAAMAWGTSDFLGGYFSRRVNAFVFTFMFNLGGLLLVGTASAASRTAFPSGRSVLWVLAGGMAGSAGVAVFFHALARGSMGLIAPVAAVLGAAIPAIFSMVTEGAPSSIALLGFVFAAAGLWLMTRTEDGGAPKGIGLAVLAGIGFACFYICVRQAGSGSALWFATLTRTGGLLVTGAIVLLQGNFREISLPLVPRSTITGGIDSLGTLLFVFASQSGRLDEAVVISSLYPAITVVLARFVLKEHFTRWKFVGLLAALAAVPMIGAG
jgi:drug/metabolite transporter (DMT)-like permease